MIKNKNDEKNVKETAYNMEISPLTKFFAY
jgi:hypothetical protein